MRNKLFLACSLTVLLTACQKKDNNVPIREKKVLLTQTNTTYANGGSTMITEYTYDDNGRLITELKDKGTANEQLITYTYDSKGNIAVKKFPNRGSLRTEYTYDNQSRVTSSQKYSTDGSMDEKRTYTYFDDRIEEVLTSKAGYSTKRLFTYTADKKNIGSIKLYDVRGNIWIDNTYTYGNIKNPEKMVYPATPYSTSANVIEKTVTIDYDDPTSPATYISTFTFVANTNGYPSSVAETSNGKPYTTTTYEYVIK